MLPGSCSAHIPNRGGGCSLVGIFADFLFTVPFFILFFFFFGSKSKKTEMLRHVCRRFASRLPLPADGLTLSDFAHMTRPATAAAATPASRPDAASAAPTELPYLSPAELKPLFGKKVFLETYGCQVRHSGWASSLLIHRGMEPGRVGPDKERTWVNFAAKPRCCTCHQYSWSAVIFEARGSALHSGMSEQFLIYFTYKLHQMNVSDTEVAWSVLQQAGCQRAEQVDQVRPLHLAVVLPMSLMTASKATFDDGIEEFFFNPVHLPDLAGGCGAGGHMCYSRRGGKQSVDAPGGSCGHQETQSATTALSDRCAGLHGGATKRKAIGTAEAGGCHCRARRVSRFAAAASGCR